MRSLNHIWKAHPKIVATHNPVFTQVRDPEVQIPTQDWVCVDGILVVKVDRLVPCHNVGRAIPLERTNIPTILREVFKHIQAIGDPVDLLQFTDTAITRPRIDATDVCLRGTLSPSPTGPPEKGSDFDDIASCGN